MPSSSSRTVERGLDAMLIVYALLEGHPAATACEEFIRNRTGWFTTGLSLLEAKAVLTKVYGVNPPLVSQKLAELAAGPLLITVVSPTATFAAMSAADRFAIDLTDAVLLQAAQEIGARWLA